VSQELSTPQGGKASPKLYAKKNEILYGAGDKQKNQNRTYNKFPRESPTCLAIRALICCVYMFASLSGTNIVKGRTNFPTFTNNIPTATPAEKANQRA
jgi:hypothetical protein